MSNSEEESLKRFGDGFTWFFIGVILTVMIMTFIAASKEQEFKKEAVKQGAAFYNPVTGEFTWGKLQVAK
jgi:hypothetical protein